MQIMTFQFQRGCHVAAGGLALLYLAGGCAQKPNDHFQGYIEGEYVYVAAPLAGRLDQLAVSRGQEVRVGQLLFVLEHQAESAGVREAENRLSQATARWDNLKKGLRPTEIATLEAQQQQAEADLKLAELELRRRIQLSKEQVIAPGELDVYQARRDADTARVEALKSQIETARLGARTDEIKAAEAEVAADRAALERAQWSLSQKQQASPTNAWVHDTLYRQGEFVAAGNPVVSLLPPTHLKVRFFVPQARLPEIQLGRSVNVTFDGSDRSFRATVNYVSTQAEFTPPVIYSLETRAKLVFMIEAIFAPEDAAQLRPGQPVTVRLAE